MKKLLALFILLSLVLANHQSVFALLKSESGRKCSDIENGLIKNIIYSKTPIKSNVTIRLCDTRDFFGLMAGLPGKPVVYISTTGISELTDSGLEWLVLHETGHYVLLHPYKWAAVQAVLILIGIFIIISIHRRKPLFTILIIPILVILVGLISTHFDRAQEIQANQFALDRMPDSRGLQEGARALMRVYDPKKKVSFFEAFIRSNFYVWDSTARQNMLKMNK